MEVEEKQVEQSCDMYDPKQIKINWQPYHKVILKIYETDTNLFFTYFNNSIGHLNLYQPWSELDKILLFDMLYKLFKSTSAPTKGIWGIISLKFNNKNGLMCYSYYTSLRNDLICRKNIEDFRNRLKIAIEKNNSISSAQICEGINFENEYEKFANFFKEELNLISIKLNENTINQICKIIGIDFLEISCRVKVRVDKLVEWLQNDTNFNLASILKKDPLKDINRIESSKYLIVKQLNYIDDEEKDDIQLNESKNNKTDNQMIDEQQDRSNEIAQDQINQHDRQQIKGKRRRQKIDFELIKPIFNGEIESEPELSVYHQRRHNGNNNNNHHLNATCQIENNQNIISFSQSTIPNFSQFSNWTQDDQVIRDIGDIDDQFNFKTDDDDYQQSNPIIESKQDHQMSLNFEDISCINQDIRNQQGNFQSQSSLFDEASISFFNNENMQKKIKKNDLNQVGNDMKNPSQIIISDDEGVQECQKEKINKINYQQENLKRVKVIKQQNEGNKQKRQIGPRRRNIMSRKEKKAKLHQFQEELLQEQDQNYKSYKEAIQKKKVEIAVKKLQQETKKIKDPNQRIQKGTNATRLKSKKLLMYNNNIKNKPIQEKNIITQNMIYQKHQNKINLQEQQRKEQQLKRNQVGGLIDASKSNQSYELEQENQNFNLNKTKNKNKIVYIDNDDNEEISYQEDIENIGSLKANTINKRKLQKDNQINSTSASDKKNVSELFKRVRQNFYSKIGLQNIEEQQSENIIQNQKIYKQQNLDEDIVMNQLQNNLIQTLTNKEQFVYYRIEDIESKKEITKNNIVNQNIHLNNNLLQEATDCLKQHNFNITYIHISKIEMDKLFTEVLSNKISEELNPKIVNQFKDEIVAILRNQRFWDRQEESNQLIYLLFLFTTALKNEELSKYYHEFIYKNYIMRSYKFIGISLCNASIHLFIEDTLQEEPAMDDSSKIMEIEQSEYMQDETNNSRFQDQSVLNDTQKKQYKKQYPKKFVLQSIHENEKENLDALSKEIIIFQEMLQQLSKKGSGIDFERQLNLLTTGAEQVFDLFKLCNDKQIITERFFQKYPRGVCSLNCDDLDISLVLLYFLFYASDCKTKQSQEKFIIFMKKFITQQKGSSQSKNVTMIYNQSAIHFFSIFSEIFSQKDKVNILMNLIDIQSEANELEKLFQNNAFVNSIEITSDLIIKISYKISSSTQQQNILQKGKNNKIWVDSSLNNMEIFRQIELDTDNKEDEELKSNLNETSNNNPKNQEEKQLSPLAFLVKLPSELLQKYFDEKKCKKDQKRVCSAVQYIIISQVDKKDVNYLILLRDALILKVFIKNLDFSDHKLLQTIVKKCQSLIQDPIQNMMIARILLRYIYLNLIKTLENPGNFNPQSEKIYDDIMTKTCSICEFFISQYLKFSKTQQDTKAKKNNKVQAQSIIKQSNQPNIQNSVEKQYQNHPQIVQQSTFGVLLFISKMLLKSDDFIYLFITHFLKTDQLISYLDVKQDVEYQFREIIQEIFINLLNYPQSISTNYSLNESTNVYSNRNKSNSISGLNDSKSKNSAQKSVTINQSPPFKENNFLLPPSSSSQFQKYNNNNNNNNSDQSNLLILSSNENSNGMNLSHFDDSSDSDDDELFIQQTAKNIQAKNERCRRLLKIQNALAEINSKIMKLIQEFIKSMQNYLLNTLKILNYNFQLRIKTDEKQKQIQATLISNNIRILGSIVNSEFHQKPESAFEVIENLFLTTFLTEKIVQINTQSQYKMWRYNILFFLYKYFLQQHFYQFTILKQSTTYQQTQFIFKSGTIIYFTYLFNSIYQFQSIKLTANVIEKMIQQMMTSVLMILMHSFEGKQVTNVSNYCQYFKAFLDRISQFQSCKCIENIKVFPLLVKMSQEYSDKSELDVLQVFIQNMKQQLKSETNRYLEKYVIYQVLGSIRVCLSEIIFNKTNAILSRKIFKRVMYFLYKLQSPPREELKTDNHPIINITSTLNSSSQRGSQQLNVYPNNLNLNLLYDSINDTWNQLFIKEQNQECTLQKFVLQKPIILESLLADQQSKFDFNIILKYCVKINYKNFIQDLCLYLKNKDTEQLILKKTTFVAQERYCIKLLTKNLQSHLKDAHSSQDAEQLSDQKATFNLQYLRVLMQNIQEIQCKYFKKNHFQKFQVISDFYKEIMKNILKTKPSQNEEKMSNMILEDTFQEKQRMLNSFIKIILILDQIQLLASMTNFESNFLIKETEDQIKSLLKIIFDESFFQNFSTTIRETIQGIQMMVIRRILQLLKSFDKKKELTHQFISELSQKFWNYFLQTTLTIAWYFDRDILIKFESGKLSNYSQIYRSDKIFIDKNNKSYSPQLFHETFNQIKLLAKDIDSTLPLLLINMEGFKCSEFLSEVLTILQEKKQILIQIGDNTNIKDLIDFLDKV